VKAARASRTKATEGPFLSGRRKKRTQQQIAGGQVLVGVVQDLEKFEREGKVDDPVTGPERTRRNSIFSTSLKRQHLKIRRVFRKQLPPWRSGENQSDHQEKKKKAARSAERG